MSKAVDQIIDELNDRIHYLEGKVEDYRLLPDQSLARAWRIRLAEARYSLTVVADHLED